MACCLTGAAWGAGTWLPGEWAVKLCCNRISLVVRADVLVEQPITESD